MMTNVMCGAYPDVFAAASCYSGFPAGCLAGAAGSSAETGNPACAWGEARSSEDWAQAVWDMYPGYNGTYPRTMIWHGTADDMILYPNLAETLKQWSTVFDLSFTKNVTDDPHPGYTKMIYGDGMQLLRYSAEGVGHTVPADVEVDLEWFGL